MYTHKSSKLQNDEKKGKSIKRVLNIKVKIELKLGLYPNKKSNEQL